MHIRHQSQQACCSADSYVISLYYLWSCVHQHLTCCFVKSGEAYDQLAWPASVMPGLDRRSTRWCCKARAHALGNFHQDIIPSEASNFHLKRSPSPLLPPSTEGRPRHSGALLQQILKDQQSKQRVEVLDVHRCEHHGTTSPHSPRRIGQKDVLTVTLPHISGLEAQAVRHKGISNGRLLIRN